MPGQKAGTRLSTAEKIVEAGRDLFNAKGYVATSLSEIANAVGISQGNLTYHFPTKRDLAMRIENDARELARSRRAGLKAGEVASDYLEHLVFAMTITWNNRFLLRDRQHFAAEDEMVSADMTADFDELSSLIGRIESEGMFRDAAAIDRDTLTRSIWIISRYWMDYLRESEGREALDWTDQERGIRHHFAVLMPCLKQSARKKFEDALASAVPQD